MSESFFSEKLGKNVWLTNHAIEAMAKREIILPEVRTLIELGELRRMGDSHGWIYYNFPDRVDNPVCAAIVDEDAIIIKTIMIRWQLR